MRFVTSVVFLSLLGCVGAPKPRCEKDLKWFKLISYVGCELNRKDREAAIRFFEKCRAREQVLVVLYKYPTHYNYQCGK